MSGYESLGHFFDSRGHHWAVAKRWNDVAIWIDIHEYNGPDTFYADHVGELTFPAPVASQIADAITEHLGPHGLFSA